MDARTRALHEGLIRLAKGAIKLWEHYVAPPSAQYPEAPLPPPQRAAPAGEPK
jgi:hypothetical protein